MSVTVRPATGADFEAFDRPLPPFRVRAWAAEIDGRVIGLGGLGFPPGGPPLAWVDIDEEARGYPVALHKTGRAFMAYVRELGIPRVVATCDPQSEAANRWLRRLGFTDTGLLADDRKVYAWSIS